jgi:prepilin-type N-terminal cleavage/methylation domain-containing protein
MRSRDRRGFTLIELLAALALTGFAMLGGLLLLDQIADSGRRIASDAAAAARDGNGDRMFRRLLLEAATSSDTTRRLRGDTASVDLWTRCDEPGGWSEPCHVTIGIDLHDDTSVVVAVYSSGQSFALRRARGAAAFRYFNGPARDSSWRKEWMSNVTLPAAIGLLAASDTVVYPVGLHP